jgi:hypothetical protein
MRMIQRCGQLRLALEPRELFGIGCKEIRQHLDRHVPIELRVAGAIHLAHAAGTEDGLDLIWTEAIAGCETHEAGRMIRQPLLAIHGSISGISS